MSTEHVIRTAEFDPKVKTYWLLSGVIVCIVTIVGIPFLILWIPLGLFITGRILSRMECVLTNKALKVKRGLLVRVEKTIPLEKITDMGMVQGPIMRHFGIHKLSVETAGQSAAGALVSLIGIIGAKDFREAVLLQRDQVASNQPAPSSDAAGDSSAVNSGSLGEINNSLLRIEALLEKMVEDR